MNPPNGESQWKFLFAVCNGVCKKFQAFNRNSSPRASSSRMEEICDFHWENFATALSGQIKKPSNINFCIFIYLVRYEVLLVYLQISYRNKYKSFLLSEEKRELAHSETQLKSHIPSLLSHLVPCFKLTKAGSKSLAVQVDSPILIHIF